MALHLDELMNKASNRGLSVPDNKALSKSLIRPWQQESILFNETKEEQISNKSVTKGEQTGNKAVTKGEQTGNKAVTNQKPEGNKSISKPITKQEQTSNKTETKGEQTTKIAPTEYSFSYLSGLQRALVIFIYNECKAARASCTNNLTLEYLSSPLNASKGTIKTTINRLAAKGIINRIGYKAGRGGFSRYSIPDSIFQEILQYENNNKLVTSIQQNTNKPITQTVTQLITDPPVVSSSNIYTTTTLSEEFKNIDYSELECVGFTESHIIQIYREYINKPNLSLAAEIVQDSINAMVYDLKYNDLAKDLRRPPAVFLTSLLRKGQPYSSKTPEKVLSPKDEAMREYLLAKELQQQKAREIELRTKELAMTEWLSNLTEEELLEFNQDKIDDQQTGIGARVAKIGFRKKATEIAKEYFEEVVWPQEKKKIIETR